MEFTSAQVQKKDENKKMAVEKWFKPWESPTEEGKGSCK